MRTKSLIRAKYIGKDGDLGYRKGEKYTLVTWFSKRLFGDSYLVVKRLGFENSKCPYRTLELFLSNWEIIKNDN